MPKVLVKHAHILVLYCTQICTFKCPFWEFREEDPPGVGWARVAAAGQSYYATAIHSKLTVVSF